MLYDKMMSKINQATTDLAVKKERFNTLTTKKENIEKKIDGLNIEKLTNAALVLQKLSSHQRESAKKRLEELGTQALQYSMDGNYEMVIEVEEVRKRPQAYLYLVNKETGIKTNPLSDNGGGVVDIISIALRLIILQSLEPEIDGPIILDEPFKMVSKEYIPMLSEFLKKISMDFGRQIIMVTHNDFLAESCDKQILIRK